MIHIASAPLDADLSLFSQFLWDRGLPHRISEVQGQQIIYMQSDAYREQVSEALDRYLNDPDFRENLRQHLLQNSAEQVAQTSVVAYPRATPSQAPVLFAFIALSVLVAFFTQFGQGGPLLRALLILDPLQLDVNLNTLEGRLSGLLMSLADGQVWRLITPDLLHFNLMHIVFNVLMMWVLGGQLEIRKGSFSFVTLAVFVSIISNVAQLLDGGYLFGGLSGVVYGLVGYCWMWKRAEPGVFFPEALFRFSIIWLLIGYTSLTEWIGLGRMANSAHLYGLLAGLLWGWLTTSRVKASV